MRKFIDYQWYSPKYGSKDDPFSMAPYRGVLVEKNEDDKKVNYWQAGVASLLPKYCSIERYEKMIDLDRPLSKEQAKMIYQKVMQEGKKRKMEITNTYLPADKHLPRVR